MDVSSLRHAYLELVNDARYDKLAIAINEPNIFTILGVTRTEIRHSNFVAWMLDPAESHGLGSLFLKRYLREVAKSDIATEIDLIEIEHLDFSDVEVRREWRNIDVLIVLPNHVLCVENKIDSKDHSSQLKRYREIVSSVFPKHKRTFVYMSPNGEMPNDEDEREFYVPLALNNIIAHLEVLMEVGSQGLSPKVTNYITDYISAARRELMKSDQLNILAAEIYHAHRSLLDFIFDQRPDVAESAYILFERVLKQYDLEIKSKNKGFIRFMPKSMYPVIPKTGKGWPDSESFMFEINFYWSSKQKAHFKSVLPPSVPEDVQKILQSFLSNIQPTSPRVKKNQPKGKKWLTYHVADWKFDIDEVHTSSEEDMLAQIEKDIEPIVDFVRQVEAEFAAKGIASQLAPYL